MEWTTCVYRKTGLQGPVVHAAGHGRAVAFTGWHFNSCCSVKVSCLHPRKEAASFSPRPAPFYTHGVCDRISTRPAWGPKKAGSVGWIRLQCLLPTQTMEASALPSASGTVTCCCWGNVSRAAVGRGLSFIPGNGGLGEHLPMGRNGQGCSSQRTFILGKN